MHSLCVNLQFVSIAVVVLLWVFSESLIAHTQNSKPQKVSQTGDESAGRLAQSYGVLAPTVSLFYHKLTTLLIVDEEEEATGMPFPSTA